MMVNNKSCKKAQVLVDIARSRLAHRERERDD